MQTLIGSIEKRIMVQHRVSEASKRLKSIPGIGLIGATAIAATVPDPKVFGSGRDFAAWIGLVPREVSTGGRAEAWADLETGDRYLRWYSERRLRLPDARPDRRASSESDHNGPLARGYSIARFRPRTASRDNPSSISC